MPPPYEDPYRCNDYYYNRRPGVEIDIVPGWRRPYYPEPPIRTEMVVVNPNESYVPAQYYGQTQQYYGGAYGGAYGYNNGSCYGNQMW